ncbi:MAG TPA: PQQ-binding-like beta-propeller repeat protein [Pirellulales bacterium]|nr:PQQ-binding-like beta-propeller repeat protein [Pirellulales bacterium]
MSSLLAVVCLFAFVAPAGLSGADWPSFRGRNSQGRAETADKLPDAIGPDANVIWKIALPPGHSSPAIVGERIYLTAVRDGRLFTIALDRATGATLWEAEAPHAGLEPIHRIGNHAQPSPAADGERVVSFFGSSGMYCYSPDGELLWKRPMGPFNNDFGAGSSPIIVDDVVVLCQDHDSDSFLTAIDKRTGEERWRTDRSEFPRNYCTPVIWEVNGRKQIVVAATLRVVGYDFESGSELWTVRGLSRAVCMTPALGDDGLLYVAGWAAGGDAGERIQVSPFDDVAPTVDKNANGLIEEDELADGAVKDRFTQVDRDKSGGITRDEYEYYRKLFDIARNVVVAIRPGGEGDVTGSHVAWEHTKLLPFCASPLFYDGTLFTIKDGGIFSSINAATGKPMKQGRIEATGEYYSSPVAGDGKIYLVNAEGMLTVLRAAPRWEVISTAEFGESTYATPAIVDGRIYLRTAGHLYCFGLPG